MMPEVPVLVTDAVKVSDWPVTTVRTSGVEEVTATPTPLRLPRAHRKPPLSVNIVPSGPITVGTYGSPMPAPRWTHSVKALVARFQRYVRPSSLGVKTLLVGGLTAAVLMHHSRTALGKLEE